MTAYETYSYNEQEQRSSYENYDADEKLTVRHIDKYDDAGNYIGYEDYDADGNLTQSVVSE